MNLCSASLRKWLSTFKEISKCGSGRWSCLLRGCVRLSRISAGSVGGARDSFAHAGCRCILHLGNRGCSRYNRSVMLRRWLNGSTGPGWVTVVQLLADCQIMKSLFCRRNDGWYWITRIVTRFLALRGTTWETFYSTNQGYIPHNSPLKAREEK